MSTRKRPKKRKQRVQPNEEAILALKGVLVEREGGRSDYERGVCDALGWVVGDYGLPEQLTLEVFGPAARACDHPSLTLSGLDE